MTTSQRVNWEFSFDTYWDSCKVWKTGIQKLNKAELSYPPLGSISFPIFSYLALFGNPHLSLLGIPIFSFWNPYLSLFGNPIFPFFASLSLLGNPYPQGLFPLRSHGPFKEPSFQGFPSIGSLFPLIEGSSRNSLSWWFPSMSWFPKLILKPFKRLLKGKIMVNCVWDPKGFWSEEWCPSSMGFNWSHMAHSLWFQFKAVLKAKGL